MKRINGGVCAPKGFLANGIHCGIRHNRSKRDLSLIVSETSCTAAAVYTKNLVKGAPLQVTKNHLSNGRAKAIICNSGNANTCNADGIEVAEKMCHIGGMAKGSGMIHPNMATMLVFITTDVAISSDLLQKALSEDISKYKSSSTITCLEMIL